MKVLASLVVMLLLCGCMATFDRRVVREHDAWLKFKAAHENEFNRDAKRAGWYADYYWPLYLLDKENRGTALEFPSRGEWATFYGNYTVKYIHDAKRSWREEK